MKRAALWKIAGKVTLEKSFSFFLLFNVDQLASMLLLSFVLC